MLSRIRRAWAALTGADCPYCGYPSEYERTGIVKDLGLKGGAQVAFWAEPAPTISPLPPVPDGFWDADRVFVAFDAEPSLIDAVQADFDALPAERQEAWRKLMSERDA